PKFTCILSKTKVRV
ncbi:hypothetical protein CP8484711_1642B, partial [Chlamydia psittaci 84-8471/1]